MQNDVFCLFFFLFFVLVVFCFFLLLLFLAKVDKWPLPLLVN